jgi:hypothetical protein
MLSPRLRRDVGQDTVFAYTYTTNRAHVRDLEGTSCAFKTAAPMAILQSSNDGMA